ncbi:M24 family metallopeptidase [bacterium]|nr:M24 family metallopeptidase [bacterium]
MALASGQAEKKLGVTDVRVLGEVVPRKTPSLDFDKRIYSNLTSDLAEFSKSGLLLCSLLEHGSSRYAVQRIIAAEVLKSAGVDKELTDISAELHAMRRNKGKEEIVATFDAAMSTMAAHGMVAKMIRNGIFEYEVRAIIESAFISLGSSGPAFPTIVASGGNGAILHYTELSSKLMDGDLVVVDIGAENLMYAADISRTYPVSGMFTPRQRELYQLVLDAQAYAESVVRPGMYLSNVDDQDLSVHHKVLKFLEPHGLDKAFYHGIGHFLGLDVHDVGDYKVPLKSGDMFTLEPGVYLPDERLGIRIEDDYVLADDGIMCLTADLPKSPDEIEAMMNEGAE